MAAGTHNFTLEQGVDFERVMEWTDNGTAVNLSGFSARMQVRKTPAEPTVALSFTTANSTIVLNAVSGSITLKASAIATSAVPPGVYVYDLELISGAGLVTRLLNGTFTMDAEVTR